MKFANLLKSTEHLVKIKKIIKRILIISLFVTIFLNLLYYVLMATYGKTKTAIFVLCFFPSYTIPAIWFNSGRFLEYIIGLFVLQIPLVSLFIFNKTKILHIISTVAFYGLNTVVSGYFVFLDMLFLIVFFVNLIYLALAIVLVVVDLKIKKLRNTANVTQPKPDVAEE